LFIFACYFPFGLNMLIINLKKSTTWSFFLG
jgi:hypothetical protein